MPIASVYLFGDCRVLKDRIGEEDNGILTVLRLNGVVVKEVEYLGL